MITNASFARPAVLPIGHLLSFRGRANRLEFILVTALCYAAVKLLPGHEAQKAAGHALLLNVFIIVGAFVSLYLAVAAWVRRFHDLDKSGLWALVFWIGPAVIFGTGLMLATPGAVQLQAIADGVAIQTSLGFASLFVLIGYACLALFRGNEGSNRFGAMPSGSLGPADNLLCTIFLLILVGSAFGPLFPTALEGNVGQITLGTAQIVLGLIIVALAYRAIRKTWFQ